VTDFAAVEGQSAAIDIRSIRISRHNIAAPQKPAKIFGKRREDLFWLTKSDVKTVNWRIILIASSRYVEVIVALVSKHCENAIRDGYAVFACAISQFSG